MPSSSSSSSLLSNPLLYFLIFSSDESGQFWVSVGVLAILNVIVAAIYLLLTVLCFRLLHIYRVAAIPPPPGFVELAGLSIEDKERIVAEIEMDVEFGPTIGECVICMEPFTIENPRLRTHCGCGINKVLFHRECLELWRNEKPTCPHCRGILLELDDLLEDLGRGPEQADDIEMSSIGTSPQSQLENDESTADEDQDDDDVDDVDENYFGILYGDEENQL